MSDHVCTCQTCGVVNARLRGALAARGWNHAATHHVRVEGYDFRGTADPYLAVAKVEGEEVRRAYAGLEEFLDDAVLDEIEAALRRKLC